MVVLRIAALIFAGQHAAFASPTRGGVGGPGSPEHMGGSNQFGNGPTNTNREEEQLLTQQEVRDTLLYVDPERGEQLTEQARVRQNI